VFDCVCVRFKVFFLSSSAAPLAGLTTIGITASYKAWSRDPAIEWAFMVRRQSVSPTHGG
jgi:hypothetical protein